MSYLREYGTRSTPQSESIPGSAQVENSAGGFVWAVDDWARLRRFLILGSEGGSYYATERKLTRENADALMRCIKEDGPRTLAEVIAVSEAGRAPKNDPVIFALAALCSLGDDATRREGLKTIPRICRTGTHIFMFCEFVEQFRGWGRGLRRGVAAWYEQKEARPLSYQLVKYRQRNGWTHRDVLRLAHPNAPTPDHAGLYEFACGRVPETDIGYVEGFVKAQAAVTAKQSATLIREYGLPREAVRPEHLTAPEVWDALLDDMPMTAMIRNLANMTRAGVVKPMSDGAARVVAQLGDMERLRKARVHPIAVLIALLTYASGQGLRGQNTWSPVTQVVDALDAAFYSSFGNVEPSGKRTLLAIDSSGSMTNGYLGNVAGIPGFSPCLAAAAMALVTANTETTWQVMCFDTIAWASTLSPRMRLDEAMHSVNRRGGGTDCSLPFTYLEQFGIDVDTVVTYTDSETWAGRHHPVQALNRYRQQVGHDVRFATVGLVSNGFTVADPDDAGMLDIVGFDTATPDLISEFSRGLL